MNMFQCTYTPHTHTHQPRRDDRHTFDDLANDFKRVVHVAINEFLHVVFVFVVADVGDEKKNSQSFYDYVQFLSMAKCWTYFSVTRRTDGFLQYLAIFNDENYPNSTNSNRKSKIGQILQHMHSDFLPMILKNCQCCKISPNLVTLITNMFESPFRLCTSLCGFCKPSYEELFTHVARCL